MNLNILWLFIYIHTYDFIIEVKRRTEMNKWTQMVCMCIDMYVCVLLLMHAFIWNY
jgi:hypothetical protein